MIAVLAAAFVWGGVSAPAALAAPVGFVYAATGSGVQALAVASNGTLSAVGSPAPGANAQALAVVHAANGVNVYALVPTGAFTPASIYAAAIYHYTANPTTGQLTEVGAPLGGYDVFAPSDLVGFDGYALYGTHSELYLAVCGATTQCAPGSAIDDVAVSASNGSLSAGASIPSANPSTEAFMDLASFRDELTAVSVLPGTGRPQNFVYAGAINHATGSPGLADAYGITLAGISPTGPCCGSPLAMAMAPGLLAVNGLQGAGNVNGVIEPVAGLGLFSVSGTSVGGGSVAPANPYTASDGTPITFAGGRILSAAVDSTGGPLSGVLDVFDTAPAQSGEVQVDPGQGGVNSVLALGSAVYASFGSGIWQARAATLAPLSPAVEATPNVSAMTGFMLGGSGSTGAPKLQSLSLAPKKFRAATSGGSVGVLGAGQHGTVVTFGLTAAAAVRFTVARLQTGRRVVKLGKPVCVKLTTNNHKQPHCARVIALSGSFTRSGSGGANHFRFTGRLGGHRLAPGHYQLIARLVGSSPTASRTAKFQIG